MPRESLLSILFYVIILIAGCGTSNSDSNGKWDSDINIRDNGWAKVIAFNDLGMHCMNQDFSNFMILPPFNTVHAEVIETIGRPKLITSGITVNYSMLNNTTSVTKTNFWDYVDDLLGIALPPDIGLAGNGLSGEMTLIPGGDWVATGIPVTPLDDSMNEDPYNMGRISVLIGDVEIASTQTVVPVSWEIRCDFCHAAPGEPVTDSPDQLTAHDLLQGTNLVGSEPVFCGGCHQQAPLGSLSPGEPGVESLSLAMHKAHSTRMGDVMDMVSVECYACHPGPKTQCLRDVHHMKGMTCLDCHISMDAVADPARQPWQTLPRCGDCHSVGRHEYEQPGVLYKNSIGHGNLHCATCHGSPHAIAPSTNPKDNQQAISLQGHAGTLSDCNVCHSDAVNPAQFVHAAPTK